MPSLLLSPSSAYSHGDDCDARAPLQVPHGRCKAAPDVLGSTAERIAVQVRIAGGGRRLCVPKQLTNDWQSEAQPRTNAGVSVAKIMDSESVEARSLGDRSPRPV